MEIRLSPTTIGNLTINRLAVLTNSLFFAGQQTAQYNFTIYLVNDSWEIVSSPYVTTVQQVATITGADYQPAFDNFSYAVPLIEEQAATW